MPEDVRQALVANGPVSLAPVGDAELAAFTRVVDDYSIHDGMIVASHRAQVTDAIITSDTMLRDADVTTVWEKGIQPSNDTTEGAAGTRHDGVLESCRPIRSSLTRHYHGHLRSHEYAATGAIGAPYRTRYG